MSCDGFAANTTSAIKKLWVEFLSIIRKNRMDAICVIQPIDISEQFSKKLYHFVPLMRSICVRLSKSKYIILGILQFTYLDYL